MKSNVLVGEKDMSFPQEYIDNNNKTIEKHIKNIKIKKTKYLSGQYRQHPRPRYLREMCCRYG